MKGLVVDLLVVGVVVLKGGFFEDPLLDGFLIENVLNNDWFDLVCSDVGVPDSIRPDQENRSLFADSQAVNLASQDDSFRSITVLKSKLLDQSFEFIPRG